jgi:hypothetical protein
MPDSFVTSVLTDQPVVVVLGRASVLTNLLSQALEQKGLSVLVTDSPPPLEELPHIFKVIVQLEGTHNPSIQTLEFVKECQRSNLPLVLLGTFMSAMEGQKNSLHWGEISATQNEILELFSGELGEITSFILLDALDHSSYSLPHVLLEDYSKLGQPQGVWYPFALTQGISTLATWICNPHAPHRLCLHGATQPLDSLWKQVVGVVTTLPHSPTSGAKKTHSDDQWMKSWATQSIPDPSSHTLVRALLENAAPTLLAPPAAKPEVVESKKIPPPPLEEAPLPPPAPEPTPEPTSPEWEQTLQTLFVEERVQAKTEHVKTWATQTNHLTTRLRRRKGLFWGGILLTTTALLLLTACGVFWGSLWLTKSLAAQSWTQNALLSPTQDSPPPPLLAKASYWLERQATWYGQVMGDEYFTDERIYARFGANSVSSSALLTKWQQEFSVVFLSLLGPSQTLPLAETQAAAATASELQTALAQTQATLKEISPTDFSPAVSEKLQQLSEKISQKRKSLNTYQQLTPLFPKVFGYQGQQTYALLLQNEQELRPTGGFIQAVALLTFDKGVLIDTQVLNVYDLDSRQTGTVKPPVEISKYLGEQQWYLRDANWNPDFILSSAQIRTFLERQTTKKIDGVGAITITGLKQLLQALGPLEIPEYNEVVTDRNIWERLEFHSEIQFATPQAKTEYSTLLLTKILKRLSTLTQAEVEPVSQALSQAVASQQLLFALSDAEQNTTLLNLGWTGAIISPQCPAQVADQPCVVDTIAQIEANVGVNKANYHIDRQVSHHIALGESAIEHTRTVVWKNTATSNAWPKGPYKNYTRFLLPAEVSVSRLSIDGVVLSPTSYTVTQDRNYQVVSVLTETPIQSQTTLELKYSHALPISGGQPYSFTFFNQKQPGTSTSVAITVDTPPTLQPLLIAPQARVTGSRIEFESEGESHQFVTIKLK